MRLHLTIRDNTLLDTLERKQQRPFKDVVWRSVREDSDPLAYSSLGERWDDGSLDVLYTSESIEGALAERRFHLYQGQPFPPTKPRFELFELSVELSHVITFRSMEELTALGIRAAQFGQLGYLERKLEYRTSQAISEACAFLGADGLRVPNARHIDSSNLIIFCEQPTIVDMSIKKRSGLIDFSSH